jgi:hypothetical protein
MYIIVFPDGETFNSLDGCTIAEVPDHLQIEDVERLIANDGETPIGEISSDVAGNAIKVRAPLGVYSVKTINGYRTWHAESADHARLQHEAEFGDESDEEIISSRCVSTAPPQVTTTIWTRDGGLVKTA